LALVASSLALESALWQGCGLLTLILRLSSPLASLFALGHFNLLTLVTGFVRPCEGVRRGKRGLGGGGLSRGRESRSRGRREIHWNFLNVFRIKHVLSKSPLGGSRDSYSVKRFRPYLFAEVSAHLRQLLCQLSLGFLHPAVISRLF